MKMSSPFSILKQDQGVSTLQVIFLAAAVISSSFFVYKSFEDQKEVQAKLFQKAEIEDLSNLVKYYMSSPVICTQSLQSAGIPLSDGPDSTLVHTFSQISNAAGNGITFTGQKFKNLMIEELSVVNLRQDATDSDLFTANLRMRFERIQKKKMGNKLIAKEFALKMRRDASQNLLRCFVDENDVMTNAVSAFCSSLGGTYQNGSCEGNITLTQIESTSDAKINRFAGTYNNTKTND